MTADPHQPPDHQRRETPLTPELPELPADTARPLEEQLPPTILATPSHVSPLSGEEIRWWRPRWQDAWRHVGYRWIFLLPAVALLIWLALAILSPALFEVLIVLGIKLGIFMVAVALTLGGYVLRRAAQARREPFCIYCGYSLNGLPDNYRCPECGRPYTWRLIAEYRRDPQWFIERYQAQQRLPKADAPFEAGPTRRRSRDGT